MRATLLITLTAIIILMLCGGCNSINGIGLAVQGLGSDVRELGMNISWLGQQRVDRSLGRYIGDNLGSDQSGGHDDVLYYSEVGGEKAYYRMLEDGQFTRVALK